MSQRTKLYIAAGVVVAVYIIIELTIPAVGRPAWAQMLQNFLPSLMLLIAIALTFNVRAAAGLPYRKPQPPPPTEEESTTPTPPPADDNSDDTTPRLVETSHQANRQAKWSSHQH